MTPRTTTAVSLTALVALVQSCSLIIDTNPDGVIEVGGHGGVLHNSKSGGTSGSSGGSTTQTGGSVIGNSGGSGTGIGGRPSTEGLGGLGNGGLGGGGASSGIGGTPLGTGGAGGTVSSSGGPSTGGASGAVGGGTIVAPAGGRAGAGGTGGTIGGALGGTTTNGGAKGGATSAIGGASGGSSTAVATLTLQPASQSFPSVAVGSASTAPTFTVMNTGNATAGTTTAISAALSGANASEFKVDATTCSGTLISETSCTVTVSFHPTSAAAKSAALTISATPGNTVSATLTGTGLTPGALSISPQGATFLNTLVGSTSSASTIEISNTGAATIGTMSGLALALGGTNPGDFSISSSTCGTTLAGGASCAAQVVFRPTTPGSKSAMLSATATPGGNVSATLSGEGTAPCSMTADSICPANCTYSTDYDCKKADGQSCSAASECRSGSCPFGTCCGQSAACPQCQYSSHCTTATKPICSNGTCVACQNGGNPACAAKNPALPTCSTSGACLECVRSSDCSTDVTKPICSSNQCVACAVDSECTNKSSSFRNCDTGTGVCLECTQTANCTPEKSYCNRQTGLCQSCTTAADFTPEYTCRQQYNYAIYPEGDPSTAPGCNLSTGTCAQCLAGNPCWVLETVNGITDGLQGICQSDNVTCTPITCTTNSQCTISGFTCNTTRGRCIGSE